jgi:hypothetical protein
VRSTKYYQINNPLIPLNSSVNLREPSVNLCVKVHTPHPKYPSGEGGFCCQSLDLIHIYLHKPAPTVPCRPDIFHTILVQHLRNPKSNSLRLLNPPLHLRQTRTQISALNCGNMELEQLLMNFVCRH